MYYNTFARGMEPVDMTGTDEFASLLESASDLGIAYQLPVQYRARNFVANGQRIHALDWGDESAPLVILLHGGNQTGHSWDLVSLNLSAGLHLIALDQRGNGDSEWPRDGDTSAAASVEDVMAVIEALHPSRPPIIVGHAAGGSIALRLLSQHSDAAGKLVVIDMGPETSSAGSARIGGFVQAAREWDSMDDYVAAVTAYDPLRSREHIMRTMRYNIMERADGKLTSKHFPRIANANTAPSRLTYEDVARIACPTLIIRGANTDVLTDEYAQKFLQALPDGQLIAVPDCGHNVHSQNTAGFLAAIRPFLGLA